MARNAHVLIAGGGIGGLTAALALLRRGFDVDVYEQASELAEVGAGIQIAANGTRVLIDLGLKAAMEAVVCPASLKEVRIWNTGRTYKLFDLGEDSINRFGAPYWFVHRGDLHRVLRDAVTALKAGDLKLTVKFSPQANGISAAGQSSVILQQQQDQAASNSQLVANLFTWLTTQLQ